MKAEISIIIPVYNAEKYIRRCMNCIIAQSFQEFEIILINDGSSDNSLSICREYERSDPRVTVLDKPNGGAASARNMGLDWFYQNSKSSWLCFIDIDDVVHYRYLEILYTIAKKHRARIGMCTYQVTDQDEISCDAELEDSQMREPEDIWCERQIACTIPVVKLFDRELFRDIRFPEGIIHEDEYTLFKVLFKVRQIAFADTPLYGYYQTEASVMRGNWSPRHMSEPDGILTQLQYFSENRFERAEKYTAGIYLKSIYRNLQGAKGDNKYRKEMTALRGRLKRELPRYGKLAGMTPKNAPWLYCEAYPFLMIPYRAVNKLFSKKRKR